uniref:Uncharacterized protein n=1 Tax=Arundo donax TaxID=35708 RepID=A0A0A8YI69_ARUDO
MDCIWPSYIVYININKTRKEIVDDMDCGMKSPCSVKLNPIH